MSLSIKLRPRNNEHVKMFEELKNILKKTAEKDYIQTTQEVLDKYEEINRTDYFYSVDKYNIFVLDKDSNEIIVFGINSEG